MANAAMFAGLVFDEGGRPLEVAFVGDQACYVVLDDDFRRHVDAAQVDLAVLRFLRGQVEEHRDIAVDQMMGMLGKDDLFTKVAIEAAINNIDTSVGQPLPEDARQWLGMLGFRIVIDFHGHVVDITMPAATPGEEE